MPDNLLIPFKINSMDSLGQGVSKETDKITFIPKVLPGDSGVARVNAQKKGVAFATVQTLKEKSPLRIEPICPHFNICPSCHYLHTPYEEELKFKQQNLEKLCFKLEHPPIQVTPGVRRTHYRNRIQLHYDRAQKQLGMLDLKNRSLIPIPECLIGQDSILAELKNLYRNDNWLKLSQNQPPAGHVEIYDHEGKVKVTWNKPYAEGGFTQVFDEMNQIMRRMIREWSIKEASGPILDLFAGNGNLSEESSHSQRLCVDIYQGSQGSPFLSQDLYAERALSHVKAHLQKIELKPSMLILDPPRSGLKNLDLWLEEFSPEKVAYVSCDPHTMVRDIALLKNYKITALHLVDFFPSTFHFETVAFLERQ